MLRPELEARLQQGLDALSRADFPEAIKMLEQVVVEDPSNARGWRELGVCYLEIRQPGIALEALERSLKADPGDADTHYVLGSACGTLGQLERAALCYRHALELNPGHAKAEEFLIRTESLLESREHYRRGLKLLYAAKPSVADLNQALRELVQSAAIFDGSPAVENLADCARKLLGLRQEKTLSVEGAAGLGNWMAACERGYLCTLSGNWPGARAAYEEALAFRAADAFVHHALGFSFLFLGETGDAVRAWLRTLELDASYDFSHFGRIRASARQQIRGG
jgi:tetratricopeptide (TPR) repeat protein